MKLCRTDKRVGFLLLGLVSLAASAEGKVVYVAKTGGDVNDGLSWATAKLTVQAGLNTTLSGDQVWVAAGTYVERIALKAAVELYGGFAGGETGLGQRDWKANPTILDGNQAGSVVTAPAGATATARIDGFTIRNGKAAYGGGIYCASSSSPTISNNTITENNVAGKGACGGGIYCDGGSPAILNNTLTGNGVYQPETFSGGGGGIGCSNGSPTISNNTITRNSLTGAPSCGGAICCISSASPTISYNAITDNTALGLGGGIFCSLSSSARILGNTIARNVSSNGGGGIYCVSSSSPTIANNAIRENSVTTTTYSCGGGIYCSGGSPAISNNTVTGNTAFSDGGGIYCDSSAATIANTIVGFNSSGICASGSGAPSLRHSCVYGNAGYNYSGVTDPTGANGNISADPQLLAADYGEVHLRAGSPCIDAAADAVAEPDWVDMDGEPRIQGTHVDMGADEFNGTPPLIPAKIIVRVSPSGNDCNDGSSWELAKQTVQAGIDATAGPGGGDVWVAAGTYSERITLGIFFHVYGGFAGTETSPDQRDWVTHATILDGNAGGSVVSVTFGSVLSVLDGFTLRNGKAASGGGIHCSSSSPRISNNTIAGNSASYGGGISCSGGSPTISNNTISGNNAQASGLLGGGGGIYCVSSSPTILNNTITGNAGKRGGGIYCDSSSPTITNTIIGSNSSGIYASGSGTLSLRHNCVYGNAAYDYSGLADPTGTDGNISVDPQLLAVEYGEVHLGSNSPCIDAGDDAVVRPGWVDMDGEPRVQGVRVDIGADEFDGTTPSFTPRVVRVSPSGNDDHDGSSWELAKRTVQAGINAIAGPGGGDVWV
ncbi:MAG: right-handed parallel beta-helix repeat-containing protein, partial [Phycisphaerae bacterium]|nr:right-handed parallel beta-helix repeat-containing protein [Phycisphaerae bacterium]